MGVHFSNINKTMLSFLFDTEYQDTYEPSTGLILPAHRCVFTYQANGNSQHVIIPYGCTGGDTVAQAGCVPAGYPVAPEPVCEGNVGSKGQTPAVGDPCSLSSGAKFETVTDYSSGGAYPIEVKRHYRSMYTPTRGAVTDGLGLGWRVDLPGRHAHIPDPTYGIIRRDDGTLSHFVNLNFNLFTAGPFSAQSLERVLCSGGSNVCTAGQLDAKDRLYQVGWDWQYDYTDENGRKDIFTNYDGSGMRLAKTIWPGGYERVYTHDSEERTTGFTDSLGRTVTWVWTGNVITSIALPDGTSIEYGYQLQEESGVAIPNTEALTQVTRKRTDGSVIDTITYEYDREATGTPLLTGVYDSTNVKVDTTTYDQYGRVLTNQRAGGVDAITIAYDDVANTRTVTDALGQVTVYSMVRHTLAGPIKSTFKLASVSRQATPTAPAATMSQTLDSRGFMAQRTDWNGKVTQYTHATRGRETQRIEDFGGTAARTITTTWHATEDVPIQIVSPNLTVDLTYDAALNVIQRKETDTSVTRNQPVRIWNYTYSPQGLLLTVTGPRTDLVQTTTYTYDAAGYLASVKNALNQTTTITAVNGRGQPLSVQDPNGVVTSLTYDDVGRLTSTAVQGPMPATTSFVYDVNGRLTSMTTPNNVTVTYDYDDAGRLEGVQDSAGNRMAFTLDNAGNRTQTQVVTGTAQVLMTNSATFDSLGRLLTNIGASNQTTTLEYDNNGNVVKVTDPRNAITQHAFDGLNRVRQVTDPLNGVTQLVRNGQDQVTSVTDPKGSITTYTVNGFGFVTQEVSADRGTIAYTYDLAGNVRSRSDARKIVTNYTYDAVDRPLTRTYPSAAVENVTFGYDATTGGNKGIGRLTSVTDSSGTASFVYDAYGNRISETRIMAGRTYTTGYEYDLAGEVTKITYPSGLIVNYARDTQGRVSGVTVQANAAATPVAVASNAQYMPFGPMQALTLGNGVQRTFTYDQDYRLTRMEATGPTAQDVTLGYDDAGNVTALTDAVSATLTQTFEYDLGGRLKKGIGFYGTDNYTYDANGNRLTRSLVNGPTTNVSYTYTAGKNRMASSVTGATTLTYTYDASGNRTAVKQGNQTQVAYTYNADGRLKTVAGATLTYNAFGERAIEAVTGGGTHFLFGDDGLLLAEHNTAGQVVRNYIYLDGQPFALADAAGNVSYILNDQIGQPQKMLNGSGAVTWQRVAGIFGDTVSQPIGATAANPQRFPGQQAMSLGGLYYNYMRDYDPVTGRYIESDPIGLAGGANPYLYALANPVNYSDPSGEFVPLLVGFAIGAGLEALTNPCASAGDILLAGALGTVGGGLSKAAFLSLGAKSLTRQTGKEWSHSIARQQVDRHTSGAVNKLLNQRGGLNGSWRSPASHARHDASRHVPGVNPMPLPFRALDRVPDWLKGTAAGGGVGAGVAGAGCECN